MFKTLEDQQRAVHAAHFQQESARGLEQIFSAFSTLIRCESNTRLITSLCREFMGEDVAPSLDTFRSMVEINPEVMKTLATRAVERTREMLVEDILSLLKAKGIGYDDFNLRAEENRLKHFSLEALENRLEEIRRKHRMASAPVPILKAIVADAHRNQGIDGYPALPSSLWDGTKHVKVDADYLNNLARTDLWQFKKLVRLYGSAQIDRARGIK
jgi:hypothetical protein